MVSDPGSSRSLAYSLHDPVSPSKTIVHIVNSFVVHSNGDSSHESRRFTSFRDLDHFRQFFKIFEDKHASGFPVPHHSSLVSPILAAPMFDSIDRTPSRRISPCSRAFDQESPE